MTDLEKYLTGYCKKHNCTEAEAKTHAMVKNVAEYYEHVNDGKIGLVKLDAGCGGAQIGGYCK